MPTPAAAHSLPIAAALPAVRAALAARTLAIVQAPPGAGKSTVLPLALLEEPWLGGRRIVMLEPRRLATRSVAYWMAHLLGETVGATIGYRMRLESRVSRKTRIEVVTEGVLTRMLQDDAALEGVGAVIFDEFHERSLQADLGLALCLDAQKHLRADLRLLLMSATLDASRLAALLGDAPVVTAEGRSFAVETRHARQAPPARIETEVTASILRALREEAGDVLVFLPGQGEIRRVQRLLEEGELPAAVHVLPLYGDLPQAMQEAAIAPSADGERKVVLSTSIAETSLTIEGVSVVVDGGLSRRAQFDPRSGMTRLVTTRVSRAAADQRRGRAGRLGPGVCYRLWTGEMETRLAPYTPPEILQADLAPLALDLAAWGVNDPADLTWLDPPPGASLQQARDLLRLLGALDARGRITAHGQAMNRLGVHPRLAHMLLKARDLGLGETAACLAALLSERDILRRPPEARSADLRLRLEALRDRRGLPPGVEMDRGARDRVRKLAQSWLDKLTPLSPRRSGGSPLPVKGQGGSRPTTQPSNEGSATDEVEAAGLLVAFAYPDRVGRRRGQGRGRYVLSGGRGALLSETDPLAREEFLAIADLDAGEREARVFLAAPIEREAMERHFADRIEEREVVVWDEREQAVIARRERRLDGLLIEEIRLERPDPALTAGAMIHGIRALGIAALPWDRDTRAWQARVLFLKALQLPGADGDWPEVSDAGLLATIEIWLAPWLAGVTRGDHLARLDLRAALAALLSYDRQRRLDELAPTHLTVPSGSRIALDYASGTPVLSVKLQEVFGLRETPRVAGGRVPVTVHLLSPAGRPVQVTRDLAGFWQRGYHDVRKELKGRYPKHYWPEDPHTAIATRRVRPR